jgi:transposase
MAHIQTMEATKLLPEYHEIDLRICGSPAAHYDETGHPVQKEGQGQHGWVKTASDSPDTIYRLGQTRGKGNAKALIHDRNQPIITDDYSAYDGLSDKHGLCWAHPKRKFQDLAESSTLEDERQQHCKNFYERFCTLLGDVKTIHESPYDRNRRAKEADRFRPLIAALMTPSTHDPKKLATLKKTFLQNTEHYLLCVLEPNIPMTNNKAERAIRPLVIKRKLSFGSKTQKGADVMSILLSVCLTTWWKKPKNFYAAYSDIVRKWQAA